ncbi:hypothetical protein SAMN06265346_101412 [Flavobacterium hercynium]|nr:hypothetical protein SAMN06265346_101412 [Flavobacterium hercynium]
MVLPRVYSHKGFEKNILPFLKSNSFKFSYFSYITKIAIDYSVSIISVFQITIAYA